MLVDGGGQQQLRRRRQGRTTTQHSTHLNAATKAQIEASRKAGGERSLAAAMTIRATVQAALPHSSRGRRPSVSTSSSDTTTPNILLPPTADVMSDAAAWLLTPAPSSNCR